MATATATIEPSRCASPPGNFKAKETGVLSGPGNTSSFRVSGFEVKLFKENVSAVTRPPSDVFARLLFKLPLNDMSLQERHSRERERE